jgi:SHS2 domain-containing protein
MAKHNYTFDHPSDIGLAARADSLGELMEALAEGLAGEICDRDQVRSVENRTVEVSIEEAATATPDYEALAVDFLTAVMNLIQVRHFMVREVSVKVGARKTTPEETTRPLTSVRGSPEETTRPLTSVRGSSEETTRPLTSVRGSPEETTRPLTSVRGSPEETTRPLTSVRGSLRGEPYDPGRHEIKVEIKAVTYHQLTIKKEGDQWAGRVIVDI